MSVAALGVSPPPPCKAGDGWRPPRGVVARVSGAHAREARRAVPGTVCAGPPSARPLVLSGSVLHGCLPTLETVMSSRAGPHAVPFPLSGPGRAAVCHYGVNGDSQLPGQRYTRHTETGADSHAAKSLVAWGRPTAVPFSCPFCLPGEKLRAPGTPGGEGLGFPGATRSSLARPPSWPPCTSPAAGPIQGPRLGPPLLRGEHRPPGCRWPPWQVALCASHTRGGASPQCCGPELWWAAPRRPHCAPRWCDRRTAGLVSTAGPSAKARVAGDSVPTDPTPRPKRSSPAQRRAARPSSSGLARTARGA